MISEREVTIGGYIGSNGYGARTRVAKVTRVTKAIFERAATDQRPLFDVRGPEKTIAEIALHPAEAKLVKPKLTAAVVIMPQWPFYATGIKDWGAVTVEDPEEVTQRISVIVAAIRYGLILDGNHKVLAAFDGN